MVIIDEADMIFEEKEILEVDKIMGKIQGKPQFLIFSATIPNGLRHFLRKYLEKGEKIGLCVYNRGFQIRKINVYKDEEFLHQFNSCLECAREMQKLYNIKIFYLLY